ncbi:hypothetical protein F1188_05465 [Roseospira marina]|uniref:histidine kinase n=1 Tax=Roseospira marina TaxID=140057 RepID=A0A5M6IGS5_9PROT|nr:cache domain-containing protein [Roseospira marina]KAA5606778.1 hypothetical protein F1188_05465 [Roseospira marina]MBB4313800.1 signal transduction histidine kinase [Roseospira marina]MBB5086962.1 signal transduction histidine kinase [Roseospira marina]
MTSPDTEAEMRPSPAVSVAEAGRDTGWRPGLVRALSLRLFLAFAAAFVGLYAYWGFDLYRTMAREVELRAEILMEERRTYIRALVETAVNGAQHQRQTVEARARRVIRERGEQGVSIVRALWESRPPGADEEAMRGIIREALRSIRFDQGRGYYFIFDVDTGATILHSTMPELEGTDLRDAVDPEGRPIVRAMIKMLRTEGEGFYPYLWQHPNKPGTEHAKVSYVCRFAPLNWGIATGDYIKDMTSQVQAETLAQLEAMHFGDDGYIFAGTWTGRSLLGPGKGTNAWDLIDRGGVRVVQELVAAAKGGGGYVRYVRPQLDPEYPVSERLSYVLPVPEWGWYIGAGVAIDDINANIARMRDEIRADALRSLAIGSALVVILAAASYAIAVHSARRIGHDIGTLKAFLAGDGRQATDLDPTTMRHAEAYQLAVAVRGMVARRDAAEAALEEQTRKLEKSNAELERFAYVASHDLREPLRIVSSYAGLLRRRYRGQLDSDADTFIDFVTDGARRLHDMIGDLLEYSRIKRADSPFEVVDLNTVLARVLSNLNASIREADVIVDVAPNLPIVMGRPALLVSLFQNLVENAIKYRHPERPASVKVHGTVSGDEATIAIADNGLGIDPAFHGRIFQIFQRLHPAHTYPGTGVGLSICQGICESHGGRIWLESKVGVGTTFFATLTVARGGSPPAPLPPDSA